MAEPRRTVSADALPDGLAEALDHLGHVRFDQFVELALYAPSSGFFATGGRAGRRGGDFITSPEVGPLFGAVLARRLDRLWDDLGRPDPFTVVEAGAGRGALAVAVRAAAPRCASVLHWHLVERSASLRAAQHEYLSITHAPLSGGAGPSRPGAGPTFTASATMPDRPWSGAVVANELLDNLPFRLMVHTGGTWREVHVRRRDPADPGDGPLVEELHPAPPDLAAELERLVPGATEGARVPWQEEAADWVRTAGDLVPQGLVLAFDYTDATPSLATRPEQHWLRSYRSHGRGDHHLAGPGTQDITVEVALDQLPPPDVVATQADWLVHNGLDELVDRARVQWSEQAGVGDLEAIRARSVPVEAEALCDPDGLGGFTAMEWWAD